MLKPIDIELLITLAYSAQFDYPLTVRELVLRKIDVWKVRKDISIPVYYQELQQSLIRLHAQDLIDYSNGFVVLTGNRADISTRKERQRTTNQKFQELAPLVSFLQRLPGIAGVAVTGSAAVYNADPDADVDILVVAEDNYLWILRPLIVLFAYLHGKRRTWHREEKNSWCFNLWLERTTLAQPVSAHSLYVAYEICQAKWLFDVADCKQSFLHQNAWVEQYLPAYYSWCKDQVVLSSLRNSRWYLYLPIVHQFMMLINYCSYWLQRAYMHRHKTRERVGLHFAFFHPRNTEQLITRGYRDILTKVLQKIIPR